MGSEEAKPGVNVSKADQVVSNVPAPLAPRNQHDPASSGAGLFQEPDLSGTKTPPKEKKQETVGPKDEYAIA